jgi:hypothetical protein
MASPASTGVGGRFAYPASPQWSDGMTDGGKLKTRCFTQSCKRRLKEAEFL